MSPESTVSIGADHSSDFAIHDEIKCRAYKFYEQRDAGDGHQLEDELQTELPRVLYAAAHLEKYIKGELGDIKSVRAARVYLRALSAYISLLSQNRVIPGSDAVPIPGHCHARRRGLLMEKLYAWHTRIGPFYIAESGGRFHAFYQDDDLGSYASPGSALAEVAGGHTFSIAGGINTANLGIPENLNEWSRLL